MTVRGVGLLVGAAVLFTVGFRFGYPDLAGLGAAAGTALGWAVATVAWRPSLSVTRAATPDRVARGAAAELTLTVRNTSRWRTASLVTTDGRGSVRVTVPLPRLRAGTETVVSCPVPTERRGVVTLGPLRVIRADPLGLLSLAPVYGDTSTVWVHPRIHPLSAVPAGIARSLDGRVDRAAHGTITFDTLREYVMGDELRHVHWRISAKVGELMVREHVDTSLPSLVVLLDDRATAHTAPNDGMSDSFEAACEAAASVLAAARREGLLATLRLLSSTASGPFLDVLTEAALDDGVDRLGAGLRLLRRERPGDTLVFLTGGPGRGDLGAVAALRGAYRVVVAGVLGDGEAGAGPADVTVLAARDGAGFAAGWDGVRGW